MKFLNIIKYSFAALLLTLSFTSCENKENRLYLSSWTYSFDDTNYSILNQNDFYNLNNILPKEETTGYVYLRTRFSIPKDSIYENSALCIGKVLLAAKFYLNDFDKTYENEIGRIGYFPEDSINGQFSAGNKYSLVPLPKNLIAFDRTNELKIKLYINGKAGIYGIPFISDYETARITAEKRSFFFSKLNLIFSIIFLFVSIMFLLMYFSMSKDKRCLKFSEMCFFTSFYLFPYCISEYPWLIGIISYDFHIKLCLGIAPLFVCFTACSFIMEFIQYKPSLKFKLFRLAVLLAGVIFCSTIKNVYTFYKVIPLTIFFISIQTIFLPYACYQKGKEKNISLKSKVKSFVEKSTQDFNFFMKNSVIEDAEIKAIIESDRSKSKIRAEEYRAMDEEDLKSIMGISVRRTIISLLIGFAPFFLFGIADLIIKFPLSNYAIPHITFYGWILTCFTLVVVLILTFSHVKKQSNYLLSNLKTIIQKNTEELQRKTLELEHKTIQSDRDLEMAAQIQEAFLPKKLGFFGWDIAVNYKPLSKVSGDLFDFYMIEGMLRGFGLFDVSGHGISSGLVTMLAKGSIQHAFISSLPLKLGDAMLRINESIIKNKGNIENYLTGGLFRIDKDNPSKLEFVNAGSPHPILKRYKKDKAIFLQYDSADSSDQHGMLGIEGLDVFFNTIPFSFDEGDVLVLYTDGLIESENFSGDQYGKKRLLNFISELSDDMTSDEIMNEIMEDFKDFVGNQTLDDDITVIVIKKTKDLQYITNKTNEEIGVLETLD